MNAGCGPECTQDGLHFSNTTYDAALQIWVNSLWLHWPQSRTSTLLLQTVCSLALLSSCRRLLQCVWISLTTCTNLLETWRKTIWRHKLTVTAAGSKLHPAAYGQAAIWIKWATLRPNNYSYHAWPFAMLSLSPWASSPLAADLLLPCCQNSSCWLCTISCENIIHLDALPNRLHCEKIWFCRLSEMS